MVDKKNTAASLGVVGSIVWLSDAIDGVSKLLDMSIMLNLPLWLSWVIGIISIGLLIYGFWPRNKTNDIIENTRWSEEGALRALEIERAKHSETVTTAGNVTFMAIFFGGFVALAALTKCTENSPSDTSAAGTSIDTGRVLEAEGSSDGATE